MQVKKYVLKKPIKALQVTKANIDELNKFVGDSLGEFASDFVYVHVDEEDGWTEVYLNDYIVRNNGVFTHYSSKEFKRLFKELKE